MAAMPSRSISHDDQTAVVWFAWLTDVFASSGFFHGEAWALEKQRNWTALRHEFRLWWPVTAVRAPFLWASAFVGRHPWLGVWSRRLWVVGGCAVLGWFGPGWLYPWLPVPLPGVIGWIATVVLFLAFVFYVPRIRGMAILRPVKATCLVAVLYGVYWALTSVTFHYTYGVDVWSYTLWEDIAAVWNRGGNLRWSAFWLLVADTAVWVVLIVFVWTRVSRVWVAFKLWSLRIMIWVIRAAVFFSLSYFLATALGYGVWQLADDIARALAAFPYGAETIGKAPAWALLAVVFVFRTHRAEHGYRRSRDRHRRALLRVEALQHRRARRHRERGQIRRSGCEAPPHCRNRRAHRAEPQSDGRGLRGVHAPASYLGHRERDHRRRVRRARLRVSGGGVSPCTAPGEARQTRLVAVRARAGGGVCGGPDGGGWPSRGGGAGCAAGGAGGCARRRRRFDLPGAGDEVEAAPVPVPDTTDRDAFLAPDPVDPPESSGSPVAGEDAHGAPPAESHGAPEPTSAAGPHVDEDAEALELERARAEERQFAAEDSAEDHRHELRQAQLASTPSDYDRYADDSDYDLLGHEDDDDPFDPSAERDDFESGQGEFYSGEPPVPSGPFGTPFPPEEGTGEGGDAAPEPLAEEDALGASSQGRSRWSRRSCRRRMQPGWTRPGRSRRSGCTRTR